MLELQSAEEIAASLTTLQEVLTICDRIDSLTGNAQKCVHVLKKSAQRIEGLQGMLTEYRQYSAIVYTSSVSVESFAAFQAMSRYGVCRLERVQAVIEAAVTTKDMRLLGVCAYIEASSAAGT